MYDVRYISVDYKGEAFYYKLFNGNDHLHGEFIIIQLTAGNNNYFDLYSETISKDGKVVKAELIKSMEKISQLHGSFFQLLIKNIDAVNNKETREGLVINRESFMNNILPHMQPKCE